MNSLSQRLRELRRFQIEQDWSERYPWMTGTTILRDLAEEELKQEEAARSPQHCEHDQ